MRRWFLFAALAGCYRPAAAADCAIACAGGCPDDLVCNAEQLCTADPATRCTGAPGDGAVVTHTDAGLCYGGAKLVTVCFAAPPTGTQTLTSVATGAGDCPGTLQLLQGDVHACVIAADNVSLRGGAITGPNVLVVVAATSIVVDDATTVSAGAARCNTPAGSGTSAGGGGAGGANQGAGGEGQPGPALAGTTGLAGTPYGEPFPIAGGCQGGDGGGAQHATGGAGGGALILIAPSITIAQGATLLAPGLGGAGAVAKDNGGGGGGSGGLLAFYADELVIDLATLVAAGGGGGGGSTADQPGDAGSDGTSAVTGAGGGLGGLHAQNQGGAGSSPSQPAGSGIAAPAPDGGGGGGGGAGWIAVWATTATITSNETSPAVTQHVP